MQGQTYQVKTVLEECDARDKTFLSIKDSHGKPLGHSASGSLLLATLYFHFETISFAEFQLCVLAGEGICSPTC